MVVQSRFEEAGDVVGIITRGPEPLASQFSTSYGMVTNLLSTRTMEEARAFVSRSFNNYLGPLPLVLPSSTHGKARDIPKPQTCNPSQRHGNARGNPKPYIQSPIPSLICLRVH